MRWLVGLLLVAMLALAPARAQDKPLRGVALVVGQSDYGGMPILKNPANDAAAMSDLLGRLGFDVTTALDEAYAPTDYDGAAAYFEERLDQIDDWLRAVS